MADEEFCIFSRFHCDEPSADDTFPCTKLWRKIQSLIQSLDLWRIILSLIQSLDIQEHAVYWCTPKGTVCASLREMSAWMEDQFVKPEDNEA